MLCGEICGNEGENTGGDGDHGSRPENSERKKRDRLAQLIFIMKEAEEDFGTGKFSNHQKFLWDLMEHSESSTMAQIVSIMSMSFVGVSIVGMIVNTLEATQYTVELPLPRYVPPHYFQYSG